MIIVQIGTNKANDDLTRIIKNNNLNINFLLLVEPIHIHNNDINKCYNFIENKKIENVVITLDDKEYIDFFLSADDGPDYEISSTDENHIKKHKKPNIIKNTLPAITINNLFKKHNLSNIDVLFIDAEGLDSKIIKSIDFDTFIINKIYYENLHVKDLDLIEYLNNKNYSVEKNVLTNGWMDLAILNS